MKKGILGLTAALILGLTAACGSEGTSSGGDTTIGISMPTQSSERWVNDGNNMVEEFEELGYDTDLQYGEDVVEDQVSQIENMITEGVDALVIAPIDGEALTNVLDMAENSNIPVISYDRLIMNHDHVSYYATFDNFEVGVIQGEYIEENIGLDEGEGPFTIELFAGSPDDNNAYFFWDGAMSVLEPYIESGDLEVRSGQTNFDQAATPQWSGSDAQERMDNILSSDYSNEEVDIVYSPFDGISLGVISSLKSVGYGTEEQPLPLITGQDADSSSVQSIIDGEQTMTIFKDTRALADKAVEMVDAVLKEEEAEVNDTETYDNGEKVVPSNLLEPVPVDEDNYEEVLIESGYYSKEDFDM
ncbi:multiple monosaccharide ABC transporter substrate-binding protein [Salibacterium aidingense]|uniref:multiple monosaccharide ABC transporter substrate-binding protein n=1 Tax=Salibacterium aidingense TaxID=384933 RepID=UPI00042281C7|nr:multiple monosaccharide ABC transporter substrate-binding protein [Salibacterium aidingense]